MAETRKASTFRRPVERVVVDPGGAKRQRHRDTLATEEPLEIRVVTGAGAADAVHRVSVTMRTPGSDFELAAGFLFSEGLVGSAADIVAIRYCVDLQQDGTQLYNVVNVHLAEGAPFSPSALQRNFYTTSSCGVCGKASIEAVQALSLPRVDGEVHLEAERLLAMPSTLRAAQSVFDRTGGLHAAALFTPAGELVRVREDVGRHNALDKLVGSAFLAGEVPLRSSVVLVSGRLSFELVQKAARAGVAILAGVSAPSSLAVEMAEEAGMTLIGFLRENRFNVYTGGTRLAYRSGGEVGGDGVTG